MNDRRWKTVAAINSVLGGMLWFGYLTDYSWSSTLLDLLFPPLVGLVSFISVSVLDAQQESTDRSNGATDCLPYLPSLIGGCVFPLLLVIAVIIPPFTLGLLFKIDEMSNEVLIQRERSPDNQRVAEVYFRPVGAYASGNGRVFVRVKSRWFPVVERDVYRLNSSHFDEHMSDYLHWVDNRTLFISETDQTLKVAP